MATLSADATRSNTFITASPPAPVFGVPGVTTVLCVLVATVVVTGALVGVGTTALEVATTAGLVVATTAGLVVARTAFVVLAVVVLVCAKAKPAPPKRSAVATIADAPIFAVCI